ncbi:MAG: CopG family transcriptional regulator [Myxococcota bacterium]|jgi:hypothetical protein
MVRTQLYLDDDIYSVLKDTASRRKKTISQLLREALRMIYGEGGADKNLAILDGAFGIWKGRRDLQTTASTVRNLRKDSRRRRLAS